MVKYMDTAVRALKNVEALDQILVRKLFEERFSVSVMARNYLQLYKKLLATKDKGSETLQKFGSLHSGFRKLPA